MQLCSALCFPESLQGRDPALVCMCLVLHTVRLGAWADLLLWLLLYLPQLDSWRSLSTPSIPD